MYTAISYTHIISVILFLLIYLIKTILLLGNKEENLAKFTKTVKVPEMIISTLFLATGIYMLTQIPEHNVLLIIKIVLVLASIPLAIVGFKKKNKALAVISLLFLIGAYGLAEVSKKKRLNPVAGQENTVAPDANGAVDAHAIYTANCTKCHGEDGKAGLLGASDLSVSTMDANAMLEIVKSGKNGTMPAFAGALTDEQIGAVVGYIETLKK